MEGWHAFPFSHHQGVWLAFCGFFHGAIPRAAVFTLSFGRKEKGGERLALRQHGGLLSKVAGYFS